jgi:hypothetical protein
VSAEQTERQHRLYDAAEAFYYAGIITSVPFDAANVHGKPHGTAEDAGNAALGGSNRLNRLGAPPIVNLGFSIELYIKLLISLSGTNPPKGHELDKLFSRLNQVSPQASSAVIKNHYYCRGCEKELWNTSGMPRMYLKSGTTLMRKNLFVLPKIPF